MQFIWPSFMNLDLSGWLLFLPPMVMVLVELLREIKKGLANIINK